MPDTPPSLSYRDAGVDIEAGDALVERIKPFAKRTMRPEVLAGIGGFGALIEIGKRFRDPVLVAGTDGVGTKLKLAFALDRHDTIGIDLVAMSVNDILVQGAEPLFFLDYFACGKLDVDVAADVIKGIAHGCEEAGCALIGGETAEMPGMYQRGEYDLAGFAVGVVEKTSIIDGRSIAAGRRDPRTRVERPAFERLLAHPAHRRSERRGPARPVRPGHARRCAARAHAHLREALLALMHELPVKGMAHITGGGLLENVPRVLPPGVQARLQPCFLERGRRSSTGCSATATWPTPRCTASSIAASAWSSSSPPAHADRALRMLGSAGIEATRIGAIAALPAGEPATVVV